MDLKQINKKIIEDGISDFYLSERCGVHRYYLRQCLRNTQSHPMTKKLKKKIEKILAELDARKPKQEQPQEQQTTKVLSVSTEKNLFQELAKSLLESFGCSRHEVGFDIGGCVAFVKVTIVQKDKAYEEGK